MSRDRFAEEAERIGRKARRLLNDAGWDSSRATLELELDSSDTIMFDAEQRGLILARAEGLQRERLRETTRPQTVVPQEKVAHEENQEMPVSELTPDQRDEAREYLRELRTKNEELGIPEARDIMREKFGIDLQYSSFYNGYWLKSVPIRNGNGHARKSKVVTRSTRRPGKPIARRTNGVHLSAPVVSSAPQIIGDPILIVHRLSDGNVRLQTDLAPELGQVLQTVGALLSARKEAAV